MIVLLAYIVDRFIGDPVYSLHPVRLIGNLAKRSEIFLRKQIKDEKLAGIIFALCVIVGAYLASSLLLVIHRGLFSVFLIYSALSIKDLKVHALRVYQALKRSDIQASRKAVGMIVGRDTKDLDPKQVIRATVESVAEGTVDGIIAPLFYAFLGGAPLAIAYKAISTLDSMVGYKNKAYQDFGWASAKLDDLANFIPARLSAVFMPIAALIIGKDLKGAVKTIFSDRKKHPSPNSGIPEAAMAGALGVQLGGESSYQGKISSKPLIGKKINFLSAGSINQAVKISQVTALLALISGLLIIGGK